MSRDAEEVRSSHEVMARHARSFRVASWFLAPEVRDDAAVLYAFCRAVDDAADEAPSLEVALRDLDALERGLEDRKGGEGEGPAVSRMVRELVARRGLPRLAAVELVEGARSDLGTVRIADDQALLRYAYLVAGTVGLMMCALLGARDERARGRAIDLGIAMQLTNICRDVKEDAEIGRVYLPARRLARAGTTQDDVLAGVAPPEAVARVVAELLELADGYYASADVGVRDLPARSRLAVLVASRIYREIGVQLRARGCDPLQGRVVVSPLRKLGCACAATVAWARITLGTATVVPSPRAASGSPTAQPSLAPAALAP